MSVKVNELVFLYDFVDNVQIRQNERGRFVIDLGGNITESTRLEYHKLRWEFASLPDR